MVSPPITDPAEIPIDRERYRRVRRFFWKAFLHGFFWDFLLAFPVVRALRTDPVERWRKISARYRALAVEMGGVLIKLGQFLSTRVDVLPLAITQELAGLQDEVPAQDFEEILGGVRRDLAAAFGPGHAEAIFAEIEPVPLGAASLAQVHRARLATGEAVVVKALRPGIEVLVETDLKAIDLALGWLRAWRTVSRRVDLGRLSREFSEVTRRELDLTREAASIERFRDYFSGDSSVAFPEVHWQATARRTLTLEDVSSIKMADRDGMVEAGIDPGEVAKVLFQNYLEQIFHFHEVHADPHPGNLFVRPLPCPDASEGDASEEDVSDGNGVNFDAGSSGAPPGRRASGPRPFQVVFVDFGMTAEVPERLRDSVRDFIIGFATHDSARVIQAFSDSGVLLPGADVERIAEVHERMVSRLWGVELGRIQEVAMAESWSMMREYRDLIYDAPFQFPTDLLFVLRSIGLLSGLATGLAPDFNPWVLAKPFAEELAAREGSRSVRTLAVEGARALLSLPTRLDRTLEQAERGRLRLEARLPAEIGRDVASLANWLRRLTWTVAAAALLLTGGALHTFRPESPLGWVLLVLAGVFFLWGLLRRPRRRGGPG